MSTLAPDKQRYSVVLKEGEQSDPLRPAPGSRVVPFAAETAPTLGRLYRGLTQP